MITTLQATLWCFLTYEYDFRSGVLAAINLGGDTDTIACLTASLLGARLGPSGVERNWLSLLPNAHDLCG